LVKSISKAAVTGYNPSFLGLIPSRSAAQKTLEVILENRSDLVDIAFNIAKDAALDDNNGYIRFAGQQTIGIIIGKRPELAERAFEILKIAIENKRNNLKAAYESLVLIFEKNPNLVDLVVVKNIANAAVEQSFRKFLRESPYKVLEVSQTPAQQALVVLIAKDLGFADVALGIAKVATNDGDADVRYAAYETICLIIEKHPDLADISLVTSVLKAIISDDGRSKNYYGEIDVSISAQNAIFVIVEKRSDLVGIAFNLAKAGVLDVNKDNYAKLKQINNTIGVLVAKYPDLCRDLIDSSLVFCLSKDSVHNLLTDAEETLALIIKNRPDLADTTFRFLETAALDKNNIIRSRANKAIGLIVQMVPELADIAPLMLPSLKDYTRSLD
jgi:hypothetical protein